MLTLFQSNRFEALANELGNRLTAASPDLWATEQVIVPSITIRRWLELDIASRFGICANVQFSYLTPWLGSQINRVLALHEQSPLPLTLEWLIWRCYRWLDPKHWQENRLGAYLRAADDSMRYELAQRLAGVFDQYLTYRPDWLAAWLEHRSIFSSPETSRAHRDDERWQAQLWRELCTECIELFSNDPNDQPRLPIHRFLKEVDNTASAKSAKSTESGICLARRVSVFALPSIPPLAISLLRKLAYSHRMAVHLYLINPCQEYWYDLAAEACVEDLTAQKRADDHEVSHPLLAQWGRQTQLQLHLLQELTEGAVFSEASVYIENKAPTWLAAIQNAMLYLQAQPTPPALGTQAPVGIEVHRCHSLLRQIEGLHDRLLALFDEMPTLTPADVLVTLPDLAVAAPLIDAVFGTANENKNESHRKRSSNGKSEAFAEISAEISTEVSTYPIPYQITGLRRSQINPIVRVLSEWLRLAEREVVLSDMLAWLRVDAIAARYHIDANALEIIETWLIAAGARRGFARDYACAPASHTGARNRGRHTFSDALMRLYLGYALPADAPPVGDWLPILSTSSMAEAEAEQASPLGPSVGSLLGRLSHFIDKLTEFAHQCMTAHLPCAWRKLLLNALDCFFSAEGNHAPFVSEVRDAIYRLTGAMTEGAVNTPVPAAVIRIALTTMLDTNTCSAVPSGRVTFTTLAGLRSVPYRVICLLGMDEGVLPSALRTDELNLMTMNSRVGDRQQHDDERNLFLDLMLAARDHFWIGYTGRNIQDNSSSPPAAPVDELLDYLAKAWAGEQATPDALAAARQRFIIEHPLQPFAVSSIYNSYNSEHAAIASALAARLPQCRSPSSFFNTPLPPEDNYRIAFDDFERFWQHPSRSLFRDRLGARLTRQQHEIMDREPFTLDWKVRHALATRVLPLLINLPEELARRLSVEQSVKHIARALPELPSGMIGQTACARELAALMQFAAQVRQAMADASLHPFTLTLNPIGPEILISNAHNEREAGSRSTPVVLEGLLRNVTPDGLVIYRYTPAAARDYLCAWLRHLILCATAPAGISLRTVWLGNDQKFMLRRVDDAHRWLGELIALYRMGRCHPLRFFPKSAWALVSEGLAACNRVWTGNAQRVGEADDAYLRTALCTDAEAIADEHFAALAQSVFKPMMMHLIDEV